MPSSDMVREANMVGVKNAVKQVNKEISTRFDFEDSDSHVGHKEQELTLFADGDSKIGQVNGVLMNELAERNAGVRFLDYQGEQKIGGGKVKQVVKIKKGVSDDLAKKIVETIKSSKIKVQASIQGDAVRAIGAKCDDLQSVIAMLHRDVNGTPLDFNNFHD